MRAETKLFDARSAALVWAAQSDIFAPTDARKDSADFASRIIAALASRRLIQFGYRARGRCRRA